MKTLPSALLLLALTFALPSCRNVRGEGQVVTQYYSLSGFTGVSLNMDARVYVTQGSTYKVEIEGQQNILDVIDARVSHGELQLGFQDHKSISTHKPVIVHITTPALDRLTVNGSGTIQTSEELNTGSMFLAVNGSGNIQLSHFKGQQLTARVNGSGHIHAAGNPVQNEEIEINGSGDMDVIHVKAMDVRVHIAGSGNAAVNAENNLSATITGSGEVSFDGSPKVSSSTAGSGRVRHI